MYNLIYKHSKNFPTYHLLSKIPNISKFPHVSLPALVIRHQSFRSVHKHVSYTYIDTLLYIKEGLWINTCGSSGIPDRDGSGITISYEYHEHFQVEPGFIFRIACCSFLNSFGRGMLIKLSCETCKILE